MWSYASCTDRHDTNNGRWARSLGSRTNTSLLVKMGTVWLIPSPSPTRTTYTCQLNELRGFWRKKSPWMERNRSRNLRSTDRYEPGGGALGGVGLALALALALVFPLVLVVLAPVLVPVVVLVLVLVVAAAPVGVLALALAAAAVLAAGVTCSQCSHEENHEVVRPKPALKAG